MTTTAKAVPSPCNSVCRMDESSGWCAGCLRTLEEIAAWSTFDEAAKRAVWQRLSVRRADVRRLKAAAAEPGPQAPEAL